MTGFGEKIDSHVTAYFPEALISTETGVPILVVSASVFEQKYGHRRLMLKCPIRFTTSAILCFLSEKLDLQFLFILGTDSRLLTTKRICINSDKTLRNIPLTWKANATGHKSVINKLEPISYEESKDECILYVC